MPPDLEQVLGDEPRTRELSEALGATLEALNAVKADRPLWLWRGVGEWMADPLDCHAADLLGYSHFQEPEAIRRRFGWDPDKNDPTWQVRTDPVWQWVRQRLAEFLDAVLDARRPRTVKPAEHHEEWVPASEAVERAKRAGFGITPPWLSKYAEKNGVRTRPRQGPGNHRSEVEWNSLAGYLLRNPDLHKAAEPGGTGDAAGRQETPARPRWEMLGDYDVGVERRKEEERNKKHQGRAPDLD
jgi:hypothetical protein